MPRYLKRYNFEKGKGTIIGVNAIRMIAACAVIIRIAYMYYRDSCPE